MRTNWVLGVTMVAVLASPAANSAAMPMMQGHVEQAKYTLSLTKDYTPSPWTGEAGYLDRAKHKFIFGSKNLFLGWTELYHEPREAAQHHEGVLRGMGRGVVNMLGDTLGGAAHLVTFPITALDVVLPEGGTDIL